MTPDGTDSLTIAHGGNTTAGQSTALRPENSLLPSSQGPAPAPWCYVYLHSRRIAAFKHFIDTHSSFPSFVLRARPAPREAGRHAAAPPPLLLGGIVFIQGRPADIRHFFAQTDLPLRLVHDCATHRPAEIADSEMRPLRQMALLASGRISFLPKPFAHYADGHSLLRVVSGQLQGLTGCLMRINRDRKLVMRAGQFTLAVSGMHREQFEEVGPAMPRPGLPRKAARRRLTRLEEQIDSCLFFPRAQADVAVYADNVELLLAKALALCAGGHEEMAADLLLFLLEEIAYHFDDAYRAATLDLAPLLLAARRLTEAIARLADPADPRLSAPEKERLAATAAPHLLARPYLFGED